MPYDPEVQHLTSRVSNLENASFSIQLPLPNEPAPSIEGFIKREELVNNLKEIFLDKNWLHINGQTGLGKTYIAKLISELPAFNKKEWISLSMGEVGIDEDLSTNIDHTFELHLLRIANTPYIPDLIYRYVSGSLTFSDIAKLVANRIGKGNLLVIDDIPDLLKQRFKRLSGYLIQLSIALGNVGTKLLTTSQRNLPSTLYNNVSSFTVEQSLPYLTEEEILDFAKILNAPSHFLNTKPYSALIQKITNGHPQLAHATLLYIRNNNWVINETFLYSILEGNATSNVKEDLQRKLFELLESDDLRNLLYRLSLIFSTFDVSFVTAIAKIHKPIDSPVELLRELTGPWISKVSKTSYEISPLIKGIGRDILDPDLQKLIHYVIAKTHTKKRNITPQEAFLIITHLSASGHWSDLTFFVCRICLNIHTKFEAELFFIIKFYFSDAWPNDMETELRMLFRGCQVRVLGFLGEDESKYVKELDDIIGSLENKENPNTKMLLFLTHLIRSTLNPSLRPTEAAENTLKSINLFSTLPPDFQAIEVEETSESNIWMGVHNINNLEDIRGTFSVLAKMTEDQRKRAFSYKPFEDIPRLFIDSSWMLELEKPVEKRKWKEVLRLIDDLETIANLPGAEIIKTLVVRAKAITMEEESGKFGDSIKLINEALKDVNTNEKSILNYTLGFILFKHNEHEKALKYLQQPLIISNLPLLLEYDCIRCAIQSAAQLSQWETVKKLIFKSFQTIFLLFTTVNENKETLKAMRAEKSKTLTPDEQLMESHCIYYKLRMLGELAWVYWVLNDKKKAWAIMSGLVNKLMEKVDFKNPHFQELVAKTGRTLAWMDSIIRTGKPAIDTDGQPYEPFTGLFVNDYPQMTQIFQPKLFPYLSFLLGRIGICLGLYELACYKFSKANQFAQRLNPDIAPFIENTLKQTPLTIAGQKDYRKAFSITLLTIQLIEESTTDFKKRKLRSPITYHYVQNLWCNLSKEAQHNNQLKLFWTTIGVGITNLMSNKATIDRYEPLLKEFQALFTANNEALANSDYWVSIIEKLQQIFSPSISKNALTKHLYSLPQDEHYFRVFLYLSVSINSPTNLQECCNSQISAFSLLFYYLPSTKLMLENFACYIYQYWINVLNTQSFVLNTPKLFRDIFNIIDKSSVSASAKILLAASDALTIKIPENSRTYLNAATQANF